MKFPASFLSLVCVCCTMDDKISTKSKIKTSYNKSELILIKNHSNYVKLKYDICQVLCELSLNKKRTNR